MVDNHSRSFFGQAAGIIVNSASKSDDYWFIRCIKKKPDGSWEKPSQNEGKVVKMSLLETIMIVRLLNREMATWSTYHSYKEVKTQLSFQWEDEKREKLWVNIGNYSKMLNYPEAELLRLLLEHFLTEKIEFATVSQQKESQAQVQPKQQIPIPQEQPQATFQRPVQPPSQQQSYKQTSDDTVVEMASIKGETEKALLLSFVKNGAEIWVPKSTIHCQYNPQKDIIQDFMIDSWILKRNNIIS